MSVLGIILALLGAVIGTANWGAAGFLFGLVAGYSLGAVIQLGGRIRRLEQRLAQNPVLGQLYVMLAAFWLVFMFQLAHLLTWYGWLTWPFAFAVLYRFLYRYHERTAGCSTLAAYYRFLVTDLNPDLGGRVVGA